MCLALESNVIDGQGNEVNSLEDIGKDSIVVVLIVDASKHGRQSSPDEIDGAVGAADCYCLDGVVLVAADVSDVDS